MNNQDTLLEQRYNEAKHKVDIWKIDEDMEAEARGEKKCPETNEFIDKEFCDSFINGIKHISGLKTGCKYKDNCKIYNEFKNG